MAGPTHDDKEVVSITLYPQTLVVQEGNHPVLYLGICPGRRMVLAWAPHLMYLTNSHGMSAGCHVAMSPSLQAKRTCSGPWFMTALVWNVNVYYNTVVVISYLNIVAVIG